MAKGARGEHRDGDERKIVRKIGARPPCNIFGAGEFGDIERILSQHAVKNAARLVDLVEVEFDPVGGNDTAQYRFHPIVAATGEA
jgi:hypothetical protein